MAPYPESSDGHYYDIPVLYFIYELERDFETAGDILKRYAKTTTKNYQGVGLSLVNWEKSGIARGSWRIRESPHAKAAYSNTFF